MSDETPKYRVRIAGRIKMMPVAKWKGDPQDTYRDYEMTYEPVEDWRIYLQHRVKVNYGFLWLRQREEWQDRGSTSFSPWAECMAASSKEEAEEKAAKVLKAQIDATSPATDLGEFVVEVRDL